MAQAAGASKTDNTASAAAGFVPYPGTANPVVGPAIWPQPWWPVPKGSELEKFLAKEKEPVNEAPHEFATEEGQRLIGGARMEYYGPPQNNLNDIGAAWTVYAKRALEKGHLDGTDVSALMVIMKVIRQARGYHRDSTVDICGYAGLMEALNDPAAYDRFVNEAADQLEDQSKRGEFLAKLGLGEGSDPTKWEDL